MHTRNHDAPWGITRMAPYAETDPTPLLTPVIDPETQIAVIIDEHGRTVQLGDHLVSISSSKSTSTSSSTNSSTSTSGYEGSSDSDDNSDSDSDSDHH
ncbi:putative ATP-grasp-modified RiPP [Streptomyces sp. NBC_00190]|uniref:putative ATP-grasp-modified RiPP n=1 Tax=unclassified Streptomyces TaxID=2593676 RepID=UPI002E282298|nr:putative ATP-grasp-modified RiPP [Streptomyces sp. NBC_00190]WSZ44683.1 putative ATP-grasp-modified RiPP [Streptomyces sp. NBC_00868]